MLNVLMLILGRVAFGGLLVVLALFGLASSVGYPGPLVLTAFSIAGLPVWIRVRGSQWFVALVLAAAACALPVSLLILYTGDGDFGVPSLIIQCCILFALAYGLAWGGIEAGRFVWLSPERRK